MERDRRPEAEKASDRLSNFMADIQTLQGAQELLEQVWDDLGPYFDGKLSDDTKSKLHRHFNFDDSE